MTKEQDVQDLLAQAYQLEQAKEFKKVIELSKQLPISKESLHLQAFALAKLGDLDAAIALFLQAIELSLKVDPVLHHRVAGIYAAKNEYMHAIRHYKAALDAAPDFVEAHYHLGLLFLKHKDRKAAYTQFKNVLALFPLHREAQFYLAVLDLEANKLSTAEEAFKTLLEQDPSHVDALTNLGVVYLKQKKQQLAIDYFTKALALNNDHQEARNNLASTFMYYDRFENALMHYDVLLAKDANNIEYLYNSGVAQMALGHLEEAIALFERILVQDEAHFAALNNLAAIYMRKDDREKAKALLERALIANPKDKVSQHMLAAFAEGSEMQTKAADTCIEYSKNLFNNYALYYEEHLQKYLHYSLPHHLQELLAKLAIQTSQRTLDLGCGTGLSGEVLRSHSKFLEGVDISAKMLAIAESKGIYDKLTEEDLSKFLQKNKNKYDLILSLDVFPYFGDLDLLFQHIAKHLNHKGYFIFSTEISLDKDWQLQTSARFAHHKVYLQQLAKRYDLKKMHCSEVIARQQEGKEFSVYLMAFQCVV